MSLSLAQVKAVFKKYQVYDEPLDMDFVPRTVLPQALWELDINPMFTDLEALFNEVDEQNGQLTPARKRDGGNSPSKSSPSGNLSPGTSGTYAQSGRQGSVTSNNGGFQPVATKRNFQGDGKVDIDEFKTLYLMLYREFATNPQRVLSTFLKLDLDHNGVIEENELSIALNDGRVDKLTDEEFRSFWDALDLDTNGEVCAAEFVVAMCPSIGVDELNEMLVAYGLEPDAHLYVKYRVDKAKAEKLAAERAEQQRIEDEENERLAREEEARVEEEERLRKEEEEQEEADRQAEADAKAQKEREDREAREAEQKKRDQEAADEKKKEGCCVVM